MSLADRKCTFIDGLIDFAGLLRDWMYGCRIAGL